jgi:hypothetical protein
MNYRCYLNATDYIVTLFYYLTEILPYSDSFIVLKR